MKRFCLAVKMCRVTLLLAKKKKKKNDVLNKVD